MRELLEIYTETHELDQKSVAKFIRAAQRETMVNFDQLARYVYQDDNGINILVECDIPTGALYLDEEDPQENLVSVYTFEGKFEEYSADNEIYTEEYTADWSNLVEYMKGLAISLAKMLKVEDEEVK